MTIQSVSLVVTLILAAYCIFTIYVGRRLKRINEQQERANMAQAQRDQEDSLQN